MNMNFKGSLTGLWELASPKSTEQAGKLESQGRVNVAVLGLKAD